ncbi:MAG: hypothetical protein ABI613_11080 [Gemmatimonadota bacterium]
MSADRDWDKEMAEIDKVIARAPAAGPAPVPTQAGAKTTPALAPLATNRRSSFATWLQVLLGGALAIGMTQWPYAHACGVQLFLYMGAAGVVVLAGIWGAISSWRRRMGTAHLVALLVMLWGAFIVTREVLPRVGYARQALEWSCP